ncbi:MAG TPA: T9SS type A sorting domain-containing protein, partial [Bacteroidota bacterium]|nr:T9SS type A sorting domain-containing protein [Bacteroidota bacterium]
SLGVRDQDTVILLSNAPGAINGGGKVFTGNIRRNILQGSNGDYRFESQGTFVQFQSGTYPSTITETVTPDSTRAWSLFWEVLPTTVDTAGRKLTASGISHFSNWAVYKPGGGLGKATDVGNFVHPNAVRRQYRVTPATEGGYSATVSFSYVDSELVNPGGSADSFKLVRGPIVVDSVQTGWNMVSVPVQPDVNVKDSLFPGSLTQAFYYSNGYQNENNLRQGIGYWLKYPAAQMASVLGTDNQTITVSLAQGWNMIGTISYPTDIANISTTPDGIIQTPFYGYQKGYHPETTLEPMHSYWVKSSSAGTIEIDAPPLVSANRKSTSAPAWMKNFNSIILQNKLGESQTLYIGPGKGLAAGQFEMPPEAPQGAFDARFANNMIAAFAPEHSFTETAVHIASGSFPVTISWQGSASVGGALIVNGASYSLSARGSAVVPDARAVVSVKLGPAANIAKPKAFALYQNYPNPFNPSTIIRFDLPQNGAVTLKLYNVLGQEVATLINNKAYSAGSYSESFNFDRFSSGVYVYRISVGNYSAVRKLMFVR